MSLADLTTRANNGDISAQREIEKMIGEPEGTYTKLVEAVKEYQVMAERGNVRAMVSLGEAYFSGGGINKDFDLAEHWFQKAADKNDPTGLYRLGAVHFVNDNYTEAKQCIEKAVSMGHILNVSQEEIQQTLAAIDLLAKNTR